LYDTNHGNKPNGLFLKYTRIIQLNNKLNDLRKMNALVKRQVVFTKRILRNESRECGKVFIMYTPEYDIFQNNSSLGKLQPIKIKKDFINKTNSKRSTYWRISESPFSMFLSIKGSSDPKAKTKLIYSPFKPGMKDNMDVEVFFRTQFDLHAHTTNNLSDHGESIRLNDFPFEKKANSRAYLKLDPKNNELELINLKIKYNFVTKKSENNILSNLIFKPKSQ
jgi:hypothetical protein